MKTLLLVDDDHFMLRLLEFTLRDPERLILTASSGEEALETGQRIDIDLLVSDIHLPEMSGIDLVQALRQESRYQNLPTILLTNRGQILPGEIGNYANLFFIKPFSPMELQGGVRELLQRRFEFPRSNAVS